MRPAVARFAAPAAFLAAATVAILLIRSGFADGRPSAPTRPAVTAPATTPSRTATTRRPTTRPSTAGQERYAIRAGDTLGIVADRYDTSVEALVELNPGIDPTALQVGQQIRVK
jgi:LysM repeat protein